MELLEQRNASAEWTRVLSRLEVCNPVLARHLSHWQQTSLADYADYLTHAGLQLVPPGPTREVCERVAEAATAGGGWGGGLAEQLLQNPVVFSAHHTAPVSHPIAWQILLVLAAARSTRQVVPVLSTDWIPMDNLFYPRGLVVPASGKQHFINLFPKSCRKKLVAEMAPFDVTAVRSALEATVKLRQAGELAPSEHERWSELLENVFASEPVQSQPTYSRQCSQINQLICQRLMPHKRFAFFNISEIARPLLAQAIAGENVLSHVLFHPFLRADVIRALNGTSGCWDLARHQGSLFFWAVRDGKMRPFFHLHDNCLEGEGVVLRLTPENVLAELEAGRIIPGMFLTFICLMFVNRLLCIGGMRQIAYNHAVREALVPLLARYDTALSDQLADFPVEFFCAGLYASCHGQGRPRSLLDDLQSPKTCLPEGRKPLRQAVMDAAAELLQLS